MPLRVYRPEPMSWTAPEGITSSYMKRDAVPWNRKRCGGTGGTRRQMLCHDARLRRARLWISKVSTARRRQRRPLWLLGPPCRSDQSQHHYPTHSGRPAPNSRVQSPFPGTERVLAFETDAARRVQSTEARRAFRCPVWSIPRCASLCITRRFLPWRVLACSAALRIVGPSNTGSLPT